MPTMTAPPKPSLSSPPLDSQPPRPLPQSLPQPTNTSARLSSPSDSTHIVTNTKSASANDVFLSLRNKAKEIASNSKRKFRDRNNTSSKRRLQLNNPVALASASASVAPNASDSNDQDGPQKNDDDQDEVDTTAAVVASSSASKTTSIGIFLNQTKSKSSPATPNASASDNESKKDDANAIIAQSNAIAVPKRASIVIGATFSHSDNEVIDSKLKQRQEQQKKKRSPSFLKKKFSRNNNRNHRHSEDPHSLSSQQHDKNDKNVSNIANYIATVDPAVGVADLEDEEDEEKKSATAMASTSFQLLQKLDTTQMKSSMNAMFSQSSQSINNFVQKQRERVHNVSSTIRATQNNPNKTSSFLKMVPQKCLELWRKSSEDELNRFAKMSAQAVYKPFHSAEKEEYFEPENTSISWEDRILTDIIRAGKLFVCGDVCEIFEFPAFKSTHDKQELVRAAIQYLERAVQESIASVLSVAGDNLHKDAAREISVKSVRQSLISLCQEFVNDPYFAHLKMCCERYNLQPTDLGLVGNQDVESIKSWTPRLCINISGNRIYTHIVRVFQCYHVDGIEAIETQIYFGFKRTYSIDCLGGPPVILPPIFLSHDKEKSLAYQISIPKQKVLDSMHLHIEIPKDGDFIPVLH